MTAGDAAKSVVKAVAVALSIYGLLMGLCLAVAAAGVVDDPVSMGFVVAPWLTASGI